MSVENAVSRREVLIKHPATGMLARYYAEQVHAITSFGIVIKVGSSRTLVPWHKIENFTYHYEDAEMRQAIQDI